MTDADGNVVDEWTSTEESHVIKELVVGNEYTMTETKPARRICYCREHYLYG